MISNEPGRPRSGVMKVQPGRGPTVIRCWADTTRSSMTSARQTYETRRRLRRGLSSIPATGALQVFFLERLQHLRDEGAPLEGRPLQLLLGAVEEVEELRHAHAAGQLEAGEVEHLLALLAALALALPGARLALGRLGPLRRAALLRLRRGQARSGRERQRQREGERERAPQGALGPYPTMALGVHCPNSFRRSAASLRRGCLRGDSCRKRSRAAMAFFSSMTKS